jgi:hypothetical protein
MATKQHYFTGIAKWAKVYTPDPEYQNYSINVELDEASLKEFDASGIRVRPKADKEDGKMYHRFRRTSEDDMPLVIDSQGEKFSSAIGNGSKVTVRVESYDTKRHGKGHRLMAVRVDDWVKFDPKNAGERKPVLPDKLEDGSLPF